MYCKELVKASDNWRYIYVIARYHLETGERATKIGVSSDPMNRCTSLARATGDPRIRHVLAAAFLIPDAEQAERFAHNEFIRHELGGEWFDIEPDEAIEAVADIAVRQCKNACREMESK